MLARAKDPEHKARDDVHTVAKLSVLRPNIHYNNPGITHDEVIHGSKARTIESNRIDFHAR